MAAAARAGQEAAEAKLADALARLAALEARIDALVSNPPQSGGAPGMFA
jgi:hypothetical protein